jgi:drug/metabolite transporter (DMT)-like permease
MLIDHKPDHLIKAALHVSAAFFLFTVMQALNKLLVGQHNVVEIAFYRNAITLIPCIIFLLITQRYELIKTTRPRPLLYRTVLGSFSLLLTFEATQILPISNANVLFFASTLMVPAIAFFFLKEKVGIYRWSAIVIGMSGVFLVAQPSSYMPLYGVLIALAAAVSHALAPILIRSLKTESPFTITFYFFLGGMIIPGLAMPWMANPLSAYSALVLLGIGLTGGLGQYFLTTGFQAGPASVLAPLAYTGLLWATLLDVMIWDFVPGWHIYAGGAIIISANLFILWREKIKAQESPATD